MFISLLFIYCFFTFSFNTFYTLISFGFGGDVLSFSLLFLRFWIIILIIISSINIYKNNIFVFEFFLINVFLLFFLFLSFCSDNLFGFYIFFECTLIPTILLILGWGYQPERLSAGYYLLFYTLFFSLPMLLGIFYIYNNNFSLRFFLIDLGQNFFLYISIIMAFLVKIPMFFIHF